MTVSAERPASDEGGSEADAEVLAELDRLEVESRRRERELLELADAVPAAVSRTALMRSLVAGVRDLLPSGFRRT